MEVFGPESGGQPDSRREAYYSTPGLMTDRAHACRAGTRAQTAGKAGWKPATHSCRASWPESLGSWRSLSSWPRMLCKRETLRLR